MNLSSKQTKSIETFLANCTGKSQRVIFSEREKFYKQKYGVGFCAFVGRIWFICSTLLAALITTHVFLEASTQYSLSFEFLWRGLWVFPLTYFSTWMVVICSGELDDGIGE